jgi:hypothetical protein
MTINDDLRTAIDKVLADARARILTKGARVEQAGLRGQRTAEMRIAATETEAGSAVTMVTWSTWEEEEKAG